MKYVGKTKIGKFSSKPNVIYPQLRLPQWLANTIGETAHIYATEHNTNTAFLFVLDGHKNLDCSEQSASQVLQPNRKVVKPNQINASDHRLSAIESQIKELASLLLENKASASSKTKKEAPESGFEPESEPRQGSMIGRYTTRACARKATA